MTAVSDAVTGNLMTIYEVAIAGIKAYGLVCGRSFSGGLVLIVSTAVVGLILIGSLTWDVSRKAAYAISRDHIDVHEMCKGGICWHVVAVRSPASQAKIWKLAENRTRCKFELSEKKLEAVVSGDSDGNSSRYKRTKAHR